MPMSTNTSSPEAGSSPSAETLQVAVLDDNRHFREAVVNLLRRQPRLVPTALDGQDALMLQESALEFSLVLVDLHLQAVSGLEMIRRLRAAHPQIGIIAMALWPDDVYRCVALAAGADDFLAKSTLTAHLLPAIKRVVASRQEPGRGEPNHDEK